MFTLVFLYKLLLTVIGVALFSYIDRARGKVTVVSCIGGLVAFTVSEWLTYYIGSGFLAYFVAAYVTCFVAEVGARVLRVPVTVILLPSIIPLVPGSLLYSTVRALMRGNERWYIEYGAEAVQAITGIGIAIVSVSAIARFLYSAGSKIIGK